MNHGSLFSGIGGFDLAATRAGWENKFHCEWNEFGQKILKYYWPESESFTDIKKTDFKSYANKIDVLTGGFPCQPYSTAGKRLGKEDDRHLWPEMLRAIREIQPRWIVGENVRGLVSWNEGMVFDEVQADLENEGYQVTPYLLPACGINAPHRRDRIWFVAYSDNNRYNTNRSTETKEAGISRINRKKMGSGEFDRTSLPRSKNQRVTTDTNGVRQVRYDWERQKGQQPRSRREAFNKFDGNGRERIVTNSDSSQRQKRRVYKGRPETTKRHVSAFNPRENRETWQDFPAQPPICGRDDGFSFQLDGITFPKWRNESIKAYGNAIVPQVALQIFKAINEFEKINK